MPEGPEPLFVANALTEFIVFRKSPRVFKIHFSKIDGAEENTLYLTGGHQGL